MTGASSGIGLEAVIALLGRGGRVVAMSRSVGALAPLLGAYADRLEHIPVDVTSEASVQEGFGVARRALGVVDAVVCSAGVGAFGAVCDTETDVARYILDVNYLGVVRTVRHALPLMVDSHGRIVVVGSLAGRAPVPFQSHYSSSKAALDSFCRALRSELRPRGVQVVLVEPGDVRTRFIDGMHWTTPASIDEDVSRRVEYIVRRSMERAPTADVVARVVVDALESPRPRFRYPVGRERHAVAVGSRLLPERVQQWLIERHFGLRCPRSALRREATAPTMGTGRP